MFNPDPSYNLGFGRSALSLSSVSGRTTPVCSTVTHRSARTGVVPWNEADHRICTLAHAGVLIAVAAPLFAAISYVLLGMRGASIRYRSPHPRRDDA